MDGLVLPFSADSRIIDVCPDFNIAKAFTSLAHNNDVSRIENMVAKSSDRLSVFIVCNSGYARNCKINEILENSVDENPWVLSSVVIEIRKCVI